MQNKSRKRKYINERTRRELNVITITDCLLTPRILWLFLPILIGMLSGVVATVGFGQIHILTPCYWDQSRRCIN